MSLVAKVKARFGTPVLLNVRPLRDRRTDEPGRCVSCGADTTFAFNSWTLPNELHAFWADAAVSRAYTRRESMFCRSCCSNLRVRRIAEVLVALYGAPGCKSFSELVEDPSFRNLDVAEINTIGPPDSLHGLLRKLPRLMFSDYRGPEGLGEVADGARNEDICRLTYPDASFDIVLSSDTLEHVPDFRIALAETRRVLRPGGRHIFTVPIVWTRAATETRARVGDDGEIEHLLPALYHGRGSGAYRYIPVGVDMLTFTEFGRDIVDFVREAGFEPEVYAGSDDGSGAEIVFAGRVPG
ncbi:type 11 methyltransferase [Mycobacterium lentiflavum]|uniref:Class I SAM-dependent methyltransferase n=1 Tax=Mycobacterium lentiflavum TaxID=141349 RepID=A0A0E3WC94_MYCLN|nr:class I SAM-dependent methyltransferase [Mycobacterium lentiflavum]MEE3063118.1 methyltransferase domain-containing protein [Actinomycetota bacterium]ULP44507.1 class I SAM-dependent methyltransferase [Mycobacterium lentiflavum]CQD13089.1 type 11 methyltransferase [Mycobacterium lentiflavum]